jgi:hypothetical protein
MGANPLGRSGGESQCAWPIVTLSTQLTTARHTANTCGSNSQPRFPHWVDPTIMFPNVRTAYILGQCLDNVEAPWYSVGPGTSMPQRPLHILVPWLQTCVAYIPGDRQNVASKPMPQQQQQQQQQYIGNVEVRIYYYFTQAARGLG